MLCSGMFTIKADFSLSYLRNVFINQKPGPWNAMSMKCPVYKRACLWNFLYIKGSVFEMCCLRNVLPMKRLIYEMSCLRNVLSMKRLIYEMSCLWNVLSLNCYVNEMSCPIIFFWGGATHVPPTQELLGGGKLWTVSSKHFASWIL